jgi:hypothetical protein
MRANDLATIKAHPTWTRLDSTRVNEGLLTEETGLEGSMFSSAAFAIIFVDNQSPWLITCLESFRDPRDCISLPLRIMIKSSIDITTFIVDGLKKLTLLNPEGDSTHCYNCFRHRSAWLARDDDYIDIRRFSAMLVR